MKKGQVTMFLIVALVIVVGIVVVVFSFPRAEVETECLEDSDCVPAECCHSTSCVAVGDAPSCDGTVCSLECAPGTLDCGQGSCLCVNGRCRAESN